MSTPLCRYPSPREQSKPYIIFINTGEFQSRDLRPWPREPFLSLISLGAQSSVAILTQASTKTRSISGLLRDALGFSLHQGILSLTRCELTVLEGFTKVGKEKCLQRLLAAGSASGIPGNITGACVKAASSGCLADSNQI